MVTGTAARWLGAIAVSPLVFGCRPDPGGLRADASGPPTHGTCGDLECRQFDSLEGAFREVLSARPRVIAVGEAHAQRGATAASSAKHFTDEILPLLAGRASDLLVELMNPPSGCGATTATVKQKQEVVTRSQAASDQTEYVAMGEAARRLGIVPDLLRPSCADLDVVKGADADSNEEGAVDASLALIARLTTTAVEKMLDRDARTPGDAEKLVVTYGGAIHNDVNPSPERAAWSFAPRISAYVGGRFVSVDIFVPEFITDSDIWRSRPFYRHYDPATMGKKTTMFHYGQTYVIVLARQN
jgi:hypothetical protein